jgi:hypothetical protein
MLGRMRRYDALTVFLLLVGGVLLVSRRWTLRDKVFGLLVWPGGLAVAVGLIAFSPTRTCVYVDDSSGHHGQCTGTAIPAGVGIPLLVLAIAGPLVTAVYLLRRARRAASAADRAE